MSPAVEQGWHSDAANTAGVGYLPMAQYPLAGEQPSGGFASAARVAVVGESWVSYTVDATWTFDAVANRAYSIAVPVTAHHGATNALNADARDEFARQMVTVRAGMANEAESIELGARVTPATFTGMPLEAFMGEVEVAEFNGQTLIAGTFVASRDGVVTIAASFTYEPSHSGYQLHHALVIGAPEVSSSATRS